MCLKQRWFFSTGSESEGFTEMSQANPISNACTDTECCACGGTYSPVEVKEETGRTAALFGCDRCGNQNFAAVSISGSAVGGVTENTKRRRELYPAHFTVATVASHLDTVLPTGNYRVYQERTGTIRIAVGGSLGPEIEAELFDKLQHPTVLVSVEDGELRLSTQAAPGFNSGSPNASEVSLSSDSTESTAAETTLPLTGEDYSLGA